MIPISWRSLARGKEKEEDEKELEKELRAEEGTQTEGEEEINIFVLNGHSIFSNQGNENVKTTHL